MVQDPGEYYDGISVFTDNGGAPKSRNPPFVQFYQDHLKQIQWLIEQNSAAASIWMYLVRGMDTRNLFICSHQTLMDEFGLSKAYVSRCIKFLKENGFVFVFKVGNQNAYALNHDLVWRKSHNEKDYAFDTANVILSYGEQEGTDKMLSYQRRFEEIGADMDAREERIREDKRRRFEEHKVEAARSAMYEAKKEAQQGSR